MTFLILNKEFLQDKDIRKLSKSVFHILIDILFLSFEWGHKEFFQSSDQVYSKLNVNRMSLHRALKKISELGIHVEYKDNRYYFDLNGFLEGYKPFCNKIVTEKKNNDCNKTVTDNDGCNKT